jgi:F-type H+-transporting ATPase subunit alpha
VFYLHSRLLERAARLADHFVIVPDDYAAEFAAAEDGVDGKVYLGPLARHDADQAHSAMDNAAGFKVLKVGGSGGSLTALPIIETLLGDVSSYIPTNVISITDGQIYLENNLFYAGIRPAINAGLSVSRVGGDAQTKAIRQVAGGLRLDMAAFRDLAAFALFSSDLDKATQDQLTRGQRLQEILKQPQYEPVSLANMVIAIFSGTRGYADKIPVTQMQDYERSLIRYMGTSHPDIVKDIADQKRITDETEAKLQTVIEGFNATWQ